MERGLGKREVVTSGRSTRRPLYLIDIGFTEALHMVHDSPLNVVHLLVLFRVSSNASFITRY